jgi:hypothetical protein
LVRLREHESQNEVFRSLKLGYIFNTEFLYSLQTTYRTKQNKLEISVNEDFKRFVITLQNLKQYVNSLAEYFLDSRRPEESDLIEVLQFVVMEESSHVDIERLIKSLQILKKLFSSAAEILSEQES